MATREVVPVAEGVSESFSQGHLGPAVGRACLPCIHRVTVLSQHLLVVSPQGLEAVGLPEVNGNSEDVSVFEGLLDLDELVGVDLHLLAVAPELGVVAVQQHCALGPVTVFI